MLIFIFGEDTFRSSKKLKEIIDNYKKNHQSGLNVYRLPEPSLTEVKRIASPLAMFSEKKLVVLEDVFSQKVDAALLNYIEEVGLDSDESVVLVVFERGKADAKSDLYKKLTRDKKFWQEFTPLSGEKLVNWVMAEIEEAGGNIQKAATQKLISYIGNNSLRIHGELKKLLAYKNGEIIDESAVEQLVRADWQNNVFQTLDALMNGDKRTALTLLEKHLLNGDNEFYLLTMIVYQFRQLVTMRDLISRGTTYDQLTKQMGLHPFALKKMYQQVKDFDSARLRGIYGQLLDLEVSIKSGQINPRLGLELLMITI